MFIATNQDMGHTWIPMEIVRMSILRYGNVLRVTARKFGSVAIAMRICFALGVIMEKVLTRDLILIQCNGDWM